MHVKILGHAHFYITPTLFPFMAIATSDVVSGWPLVCVIWSGDDKQTRGWLCIGNCTLTHDQCQSEVKRSRRSFEAGQGVKQTARASLETVKAAPGAQWAWLMLNSQGSRLNFWCSQGVKHKNLMGQDLDLDRGWEYRPLCSVQSWSMEVVWRQASYEMNNVY